MEVGESVCADQFVTLIAYFSSMVSEIGDIILELGDCQGWALNATPPLMHSRNPNQAL